MDDHALNGRFSVRHNDPGDTDLEMRFEVASTETFELSVADDRLGCREGHVTQRVSGKDLALPGKVVLPALLTQMLWPAPALLTNPPATVRLHHELPVITEVLSPKGVARIDELTRVPLRPELGLVAETDESSALGCGYVTSTDQGGPDGLFSAHVEAVALGYPAYWDQGPLEVPLRTALEWARTRAIAVLLRIDSTAGSEFYSAGNERLKAYPAWPA